MDALRGVAALVVALHHATYDYLPGPRAALLAWFDPGTYGVMVFFLVSGYIVPASLERGGDVRRFWIGRLFRIYPLWLVACGAAVALMAAGLYRERGGPGPAVAVLAHVTMMQDLLAVPSVLNVLWTLSYEMAFYLLVVALFTAGLHRRSAHHALLFAAGALVLGGLPPALLSVRAGVGAVAVGAAALTAAAIVLAARGHRLGGLLGAVPALLLVVLNGRVGAAEGLTILAVMFAGTAVYRIERGELAPRPALLGLGAVLVTALVAAAVHLDAAARSWSLALAAAAATFGLGLLARRLPMPRALVALGVISYSVYLLHPVLLAIFRVLLGGNGPDRPDRGSVPLLLLFTAVLLALSWTTQRYVEAPMQRLGKRLARPGRRASGAAAGRPT
ncbi:acyltransferase [Actinomadura sp. PM05-2]|uniref:Acyltransferase n=1 Tax=Actinomadura parmotrematis TaxID=2864039 RepID=A0ABS7FW50_9ACTN|nr:acyltransferase [Actinomadura parmotrematis]